MSLQDRPGFKMTRSEAERRKYNHKLRWRHPSTMLSWTGIFTAPRSTKILVRLTSGKTCFMSMNFQCRQNAALASDAGNKGRKKETKNTSASKGTGMGVSQRKGGGKAREREYQEYPDRWQRASQIGCVSSF